MPSPDWLKEPSARITILLTDVEHDLITAKELLRIDGEALDSYDIISSIREHLLERDSELVEFPF